MCRVSLSVQDMRLPVIIINDCWEYIIELELELVCIDTNYFYYYFKGR